MIKTYLQCKYFFKKKVGVGRAQNFFCLIIITRLTVLLVLRIMHKGKVNHPILYVLSYTKLSDKHLHYTLIFYHKMSFKIMKRLLNIKNGLLLWKGRLKPSKPTRLGIKVPCHMTRNL